MENKLQAGPRGRSVASQSGEGGQEGGCPWNLHNPARAWCLSEREKGKENFVNYP